MKSEYKRLEYNRQWKRKNKDKVKLQSQRYYARYKDKILAKKNEYQKTKGKMKRYNITKAQYESLIEEQKGLCAICGISESELTGRVKILGIDHNHKTGEVRGLLCDLCNRGLGYLKDDIKIISKSLEYLKKYE